MMLARATGRFDLGIPASPSWLLFLLVGGFATRDSGVAFRPKADPAKPSTVTPESQSTGNRQADIFTEDVGMACFLLSRVSWL